MTDSNSIANAIQTAKDNPYDGTIQQVCNLSISIAESSKTMDKSVFNLYKEKIDIEPKTFSKLKVIGEKLLEANEQDKQTIIKLIKEHMAKSERPKRTYKKKPSRKYNTKKKYERAS